MRLSPDSSSSRSVKAEIQPGIWLDSRLAVWLPEARLPVVADLHWGYVATHRARGNHPAASWWDGAGSNFKLPALVASARRLILPAFSPWAAGTPWTPSPSSNETLWAIAPALIFILGRPARVASAS